MGAFSIRQPPPSGFEMASNDFEIDVNGCTCFANGCERVRMHVNGFVFIVNGCEWSFREWFLNDCGCFVQFMRLSKFLTGLLYRSV